jgi:hypothetical protein
MRIHWGPTASRCVPVAYRVGWRVRRTAAETLNRLVVHS